MIYTTLKRIREHGPCAGGWKRLIRHLGTDFPMDIQFPLVEILNAEGNGLDDCLWALRAEPQHEKLYRSYAVRRARSVQHLMKDPRSIAAIDVAERHAHGNATNDELAAAWDAAFDATRDAARGAARGAAFDAAWAVAGDRTWAAACEVAFDAAGGAAWATPAAWATTGNRAWATTWATTWATVRATACDAAYTDLREMLTNHHAMPGDPAR